MAILGLARAFQATHGTKVIRQSTYRVEVRFEGLIGEDFIDGIDYDMPRSRLEEIVSQLESKYLDDIVGRATMENVASYIMFQLNDSFLHSVTLFEDETSFVELKASEIDLVAYGPALHYKRGKSLLIRKRFEDAINELGAAIAQNPTCALAYNFRGRCWKHLQQFERALQDYCKAIDLCPIFGDAYRNRGNAYYYLQMYDLMLPDFNKAVELMPESALAVNNRGFAYQRLGKYDLAIIDHSHAIKLDPLYAEAYLDRGNAYTAIGEHPLATKDLEEGGRLQMLQSEFEVERKKIYIASQCLKRR
ncbi:hypothetical protein ANRL4_01882 [Anaerolineae bacterium]|nr:hypothetical protein ANRL4_01882 [Anaerolineae bacterium]